jgi:hypothetical protein
MASKVLCPFFCFSTTGGERTFAVTPDLFEHAVDNDLHGPESGRDIHHQLLYGNENGGYPSYIDFPVFYRGFTGSRMCDMLDMRYDGNCFLISDRMKLLLEENLITGWKCFPVLLFDKKGNEITGYNGFTVIGRGGEMDFLLPPERIPFGEDHSYVHWRKEQWDGSDIFRIYPNYLVITSRTKDLLKKNKITSAEYSPLTERVTIIE